MDNTVLLIDGSSFLFRAYHAMPNLTSPEGKPTGAIYGITNMLKQMLKRFPTKHWVCVFDTTGKTFREEIHPQYKANRSETPLNLIEQLKDIYILIDALGIPVIMQNGIEADDIIGTLAIRAKNTGYKVLIATGDKDFTQLVDDDVTLINTMTNEVLDIQGVIDKFGVTPAQMVDYLSLVGDKVDNVPGVEKCGPKTASKWLNEYNSIDNLIANQDKLTGAVGENFRKAIPWLDTAKKLITIHTSINLNHNIPTEIGQFQLAHPKQDVLFASYTRLGFKSWLKQLEIVEIGSNGKENDNQYSSIYNNNIVSLNKTIHKQINDVNELNLIIEHIISNNTLICLSIIPDDFCNPKSVKYFFFSDNKHTYHVNGLSSNEAFTDLFSENNSLDNEYLNIIYKLFLSNVPKILPNYKDSLHFLSLLNIGLNNVVGDLTLAHYIQNSKNKHNLNTIFSELLNLDLIDIPSNTSKLTRDSIWITKDKDKIINNLYIITENCINLEQHIVRNMSEKEVNLYKNIELPLVKILVDIENQGVKLDISAFKLLENELINQLKILEDKIYADAGCVFNINSPKQLQDVLFNQLKLPVLGIKKNANGYSTDEDSLNTLNNYGLNIAKHLLEYRALSKLLNTYVAKLPLIVDNNHKIHTTYEQAIVASGRLSSKDPNLQNIPIKSDWGKRIRRCFIADAQHTLICADYSQIELRVLAHLSQDENLINAFNDNLDIHTITACEIFHKDATSVTKDERRYAKVINFSLLYGKTAFGLSQELGIDRATAKLYIDTYFAKYPKVKSCLDNIISNAKHNGYVETVMGRRIYLPNINASNRIIREAEERLALNAPMQGTSADIIKIAMLNINKWLLENKLKSQMTLQVHDELIIQAPIAEVAQIIANLENLMIANINLDVKLAVDISTANNWGEAH